jgi:hypothetical protein
MKFGGKWKEKRGGMMGRISFWWGKDIYIFMDVPTPPPMSARGSRSKLETPFPIFRLRICTCTKRRSLHLNVRRGPFGYGAPTLAFSNAVLAI